MHSCMWSHLSAGLRLVSHLCMLMIVMLMTSRHHSPGYFTLGDVAYPISFDQLTQVEVDESRNGRGVLVNLVRETRSGQTLGTSTPRPPGGASPPLLDACGHPACLIHTHTHTHTHTHIHTHMLNGLLPPHRLTSLGTAGLVMGKVKGEEVAATQLQRPL